MKNQVMYSPIDLRDKLVGQPLSNLPQSLDLLPDVFEVESQGFTNSCTANAGCSMLEVMFKRAGIPRDFSRLYLYWYVRQLSGIKGDNGAHCRDIPKALVKYGIPLEVTWPFKTQNINLVPSAAAKEEAKKYNTYEYKRLGYLEEWSLVHEQIKTCIYNGLPVLVTMRVSEEFSGMIGKNYSNWKTHYWNPNYTGYLHAVIIIGYDDTCQRFLCQNSWGKGWGDGGFFGLPYEFVTQRVAGEFWVITKTCVPKVPFFNSNKPSDAEIKEYCSANIGNPKVISDGAYQYEITVKDLTRVLGYTEEEIRQYFSDAGIKFWSII